LQILVFQIYQQLTEQDNKNHRKYWIFL